ncbi:MAG: exo-alpha-sialidase [Bacteroidaceae bacterium]|nr:exo-alpha-sialidase [Bacteroidaceae bacterium]
MKRFLSLKLTLCLFLLGMVCNVVWAQTAYTVAKLSAKPTGGYYIIKASCSHGNGWMWHNNEVSDRPFRVDTDVDLATSVTSEQDAYIWKLENNSDGSFTLFNIGTETFLPADKERNKNMTQYSELVGDFALTDVENTTDSWFIYQTNFTNGSNKMYIHCNKPSYLNMSYWDSYSVDGTSIRVEFYEVEIPETTYIVNFVAEGEQIATSSVAYPSSLNLSEIILKNEVPDGYYFLNHSLSGTTITINIALDIRPVPGKKYYIFNKHQAGYQYYYDNDGNVGFADACRFNDKAYVWLCETIGNQLCFKNLRTNKYFAWQSLSNNAYGWFVSPEKGDGKVKNDGCVTLYTGSKYLVGQIGRFDQANSAGYDNTTNSSDFCFVEYTHKPQPGKYYYFYNKHQKGDKYFYDNNGNVGFSATKEAFNRNYIWLCEEDANNPGMVTFKNLGTNKYFVWKGLSTTPLAWTVDETVANKGVVNEGCVTLTANQSGSNVLVVKNATGWDQAENAGYYTETYSSDYCFEEFSELPQDGMTYFIYNDNDTPLYLNNNAGSLKATAGKHLIDPYLFVCQKYGDKYRFRNLEGKWLAHKTLKDAAHDFTVATDAANNFGCATLWTDNVDAKGGRYFCIKNDGTLDHAQSAFNKSSSDFSTDFVFEPCYEITKVLTINLPVYANATLTVDGMTYTETTAFELEGSVPSISLTHNNKYFEFVGFVDADGNVYDLANLENATQDVELTAQFTPTFISSVYGEKWVRFTNCSNTKYSATLENGDGSYENRKGDTEILDFAAENQLWCLVGTAESFVLYNKVAGEDYALNVPLAQDANYANGNQATMTSDKGTWKIKCGHYGVALVPTAKDNASELAINMYGGDSGYLRLYTTGKDDKGSFWTPSIIDLTKSINLSVTVEGEGWDTRHGVAELVLNADGITSSTHITGNVAAKKCYLPKDEPFALSSSTYRGYTFNGFGGTYENFVLEEDLEVIASYTANDERTLYYTPSTTGKPYRIPAIATAPNGHIFAIADHRPCGNDIGYGEVDIMCRISKDNGVTWSNEFFIADGQGGDSNHMTTGYGDAAVVADRESNKLLVMMVCGRTVCHNGRWDTSKIGDAYATAVNRVARIYLTYNETTGEWEKSEIVEMTDHIYSLFLNGETPTVTSMFIGSGKVCQSRVVKKGAYYRLYCSMWTRDGGNRVIYSDDFGGSWNVLGTINDRPASGGDEPKVEELADGTVVLSSRKGGGRYFNIFTFADNTYTTGTWGTVASSNNVSGGLSFGGNSTNGEIYKVKAIRKSDGQICDIMLQSVPTGSGRTDVAVYYKEMEYNEDGTNKYTPETFSTGWTKGKHVSTKSSCYSTMIMQTDGRLAFLFEEEPGGYCIVYIPYTIEDVTGGAYSLYTVNSTIGAYEIGTFYASEAMQIPADVKAYVAAEENLEMNGTDGTITLTELEGIIPAETGVVLRGTVNDYKFIPSISYGTVVEDNMLVGWEGNNVGANLTNSVALPTDGTTNYVLTVMNEVPGFYKKDAGFNVYNNKAYLNVASKAATIRLRFENNDGTTDIIEVSTEVLNANGAIYDLSGRRVEKATKGVYIVNGKKVIL